MSQNRDSSPVYYREIQKNAFLKRLPDDTGGKLRPLALKKPPPKPLWTQLCVHNGKTPYLEQYRDPTSARAHRPVWRASLSSARHVTASVTPRDNEYDFLVDTHEGPVRMLAPDWESMQDWVTTLRNKLHELKIISLCENVYCGPPAAPPPRAAARDPTSPLPPTPPVPPQRVPGIEIAPIRPTQTQPEPTPESVPSSPPSSSSNHLPSSSSNHHSSSSSERQERLEIDISLWDNIPSTSQLSQSVQNVTKSGPNTTKSGPNTTKSGPNTSKSGPNQPNMTKICGQNIWLDNSIPKRESDDDNDDDDESVTSDNSYKQMVLVSDRIDTETVDNSMGDRPTNITVIQVSNKEPPHTAIPVIGPETDIFDFEFKAANTRNPNFVNIVNTEVNVHNSNDYGTVFSENESEYGHLSLTTTVSLTGDVKVTDVNVKTDKEGLYERLCMASTSNELKASPLSVRRLKSVEKVRKSSLPNLDSVNSDYEYLFLSQNNNSTSSITNANSNANVTTNSTVNLNSTNATSYTNVNLNSTNVSTNLTSINLNSTVTSNSTNIPTNYTHITTNSTSTPTNSTNISTNSTNITTNSTNITTNSTNIPTNTTITPISTSVTSIPSNSMPNSSQNESRVHINSVSIVEPYSRVIRSNIERTHSQNAYDSSPRRERDNGPKRNGKVEKSEVAQPKPIWKRGLTELSLLTRLRGIGHGKRQESPNRTDNDRNAVTSPVKVVHRSRPEARVDRSRRRSSSLTNGQSPPSTSLPPALQTLRTRQAALLRSEQRRGAALVAAVRCNEPPVFVDYNKQVWVAQWGLGGARWMGRAGDRICGIRASAPRDASHAKLLLANVYGTCVDILFHRVPLGKIYVITKRDQESLGIKLDSECNITSVENDSPAARAKLPPPGRWAVTEVNNRQLNLIKGGEEEMNRLSLNGNEASVLIQPSALVKKLRAALKGNKSLLGLR